MNSLETKESKNRLRVSHQLFPAPIVTRKFRGRLHSLKERDIHKMIIFVVACFNILIYIYLSAGHKIQLLPNASAKARKNKPDEVDLLGVLESSRVF